jgi:hypothetical protein
MDKLIEIKCVFHRAGYKNKIEINFLNTLWGRGKIPTAFRLRNFFLRIPRITKLRKA